MGKERQSDGTDGPSSTSRQSAPRVALVSQEATLETSLTSHQLGIQNTQSTASSSELQRHQMSFQMIFFRVGETGHTDSHRLVHVGPNTNTLSWPVSHNFVVFFPSLTREKSSKACGHVRALHNGHTSAV